MSWVHPDQATIETTALLHASYEGEPLIVPVLWFTEMANALLVLQRRKKITQNDRKIALETLGSLNLIIDDTEARTAFFATSKLAEKLGLTIYDATYLELALRRKCALATRDNALREAAKRCGIISLDSSKIA